MNKAEIKTLIAGRTAPFMELSGLTITNMEDSICEGIILAGGTVASYGNATDAECANVTNSHMLLLAIEYSWLEYMIDNLPFYDIKAGDGNDKLSQLVGQLERKLGRLKDKLATLYGIGLSEMATHIIDMNFQEEYLND